MGTLAVARRRGGRVGVRRRVCCVPHELVDGGYESVVLLAQYATTSAGGRVGRHHDRDFCLLPVLRHADFETRRRRLSADVSTPDSDGDSKWRDLLLQVRAPVRLVCASTWTACCCSLTRCVLVVCVVIFLLVQLQLYCRRVARVGHAFAADHWPIVYFALFPHLAYFTANAFHLSVICKTGQSFKQNELKRPCPGRRRSRED